jgi:hypothetical protein
MIASFRNLPLLTASRGGGILMAALLVLAGPAHEAAAQSAPQLISIVPANGAADVPVGATLTFTFDQDMNVFVPLFPTISGFFVGNLEFTPGDILFDSTWSADGRSVTCEFTENLPAATTIAWRLNPSGTQLPITSQSGVPLATVSGTFMTGQGGGNGGNGGNGGDDDPPSLVSSNPANGATGIPVSASIRFVFDQPMELNPAVGGYPPLVPGAIAWTGAGLQPSKFTYSWSADGRTLTCAYTGGLPGDTAISWALNPPNAMVRLANASGTPLPEGAFSGSFTTGEGGGSGDCSPDGVPENWGFYGVMKSFRYQQTTTGEPVPLPPAEEPFTFGVFIRQPEGGPAATSGSVTLPNAVQHPLEGMPFGGMLFYFETLSSDAALEAAYPNGSYTLRFTQTGEAERVIPMNMDASQPVIPRIANFAQTQSVNAHQDFSLEWNSFAGARAEDSIHLKISETTGSTVFEAPDLCVPRELPVTATSILIPAETLQANRTYNAVLTFGRFFYASTNTVPEMAGVGSASRSTEFVIRTGSGTGLASPRFTGFRVLPNGRPEMTITGTAGGQYTVQRTQDLGAPAWTAAGTVTIGAGGTAVFEDLAPLAFPLFYRVAGL